MILIFIGADVWRAAVNFRSDEIAWVRGVGVENGAGVFRGIESPFRATRYHSLVIQKSSAPAVLEVTAWTEKTAGAVDEIMGVRHRELPIESVQFHPESILTEHGHDILRNFLEPHR